MQLLALVCIVPCGDPGHYSWAKVEHIWRPRPVLASGFGFGFGCCLFWSSIGRTANPKESYSFALFTLIFAHDGGPLCKQG